MTDDELERMNDDELKLYRDRLGKDIGDLIIHVVAKAFLWGAGLTFLMFVAALALTTYVKAHDGFLEFQKDPVSGTACCGKDDCPIVAFDDLVPVPGGYLYRPTGEVVENRRAQFHPDGQPRVCQWKFGPKGVEHDPTGPIRCLFVAGGGV